MMKMFKVHCFKKVDSTIDKAKKFPAGSVVVAESQGKGKGRFGRSWSSLPGGVYLSVVLEKEDAAYLTFIGALSACRAVEDVLGIRTVIKWPNDLIYVGKKVCGILTKIGDDAIVGIGINTNNKIPKTLEKKATSLKEIFGKEINNKKIINKLLNYFEYYLRFLKDGKKNKIICDWKRYSFLGSKVKVKSLGKDYSGIAYDVDKDCFLILKLKNGKKVKVVEGDVFLG